MKVNNLNAAQLEAVSHIQGPAIVLAGPGSGKTKVIVERLRYMIEDHQIKPSDILVITFTKAAAIEMQYRFLKITDSSYPEVVFGTFHSVFYQIIRNSKSKNANNIQIASEKIKYEIIRDILSLLRESGDIDDNVYEDALIEAVDIINEISRVKNLGINPDECNDSICIKSCFSRAFELYNKRLIEFGMIDFDDMIGRCYEILKNNPSILRQWQERFKYILIDEYQDINPMQYKVVRLLGGDQNNIFAVGDDDQSIYGFRGSDPNIMLEFKKSFENHDPKMIELNTNYRCGRSVLINALRVIDENKIRFKKDLRAFEGNGPGQVITRRYETRKKQNDTIAYFLHKHRENLSDIAILYRTNSEALVLARHLKEYGIPSNLEDKQISLYVNKAIEICTSYISFAYRGHKRGDYYKIINKPMRYISRDSAQNEVVNEADVVRYYRNNSERLKTVKSFWSSINMIEHLRPSLMIRYLRKTIGIDELYPDCIQELEEFEQLACTFNDSRTFLEYVLEKRSDETEKRGKKADIGGNRVKIMTMHGSKGLEFDTVWLPDLNEGIIPTRSAVSPEQIEEERRMLYVAMTRAKRALIMSYITGNKDNQMLPTRFLRPIRDLWEKTYQTSSEPSSGRSMISSNSTSSR